MSFPEAGGSSSFARHAFNELVSFVAAWAQMLNYIITIAISAFFVPHYLSIFWQPLRTNPWDIVGGAIVIAFLVALNIVGDPGVGEDQHRPRRRSTSRRRSCSCCSASSSSSARTCSSQNVHFGVAPTWSHFLLAIPIAMIAYTGIETVSNMSEEARDPVRTVPRRCSWSRSRSSRSTSRCRGRALGDAGRSTRRTGTRRASLGRRRPPATGIPGTRTIRCSGSSTTSGSAAASLPRAPDLPRDPRRDDPLHRHERGRHRRVADHVRDGRLPPAAARSSAGSTRSSRRRGLRSSCSPASISILAHCCRGRRLPRRRCTRSARCSRSRSRTPRSSSCG